MSNRSHDNLPPREPGYPLIGNVGFKPEIPVILNLWQKHGDLFTLNLFGRTIIVVCGHQTLHEILEKHGKYSFEHPCVYGYTEYFESSDRDLLLMGYGLLFGGIGGIQALQWAVLYLMHYPKVVSRMQREIEENVGNSRPPTMTDKPRLPYCQAVIYEVLRTASIIPVAPTHVLTSDLAMNGYNLKKDSWILLALCTINMDPSIFKEPETFNPDRFINEEGQVFGFENVNASFSLGPRNCVGQRLAEMEMFLFVTALVQKFDIENEADTPLPSLRGTYKGAHITIPYKTCLKKRAQ